MTPIQFRYRDSFLEMYVFPLAGNPTYIKIKQNKNQRSIEIIEIWFHKKTYILTMAITWGVEVEEDLSPGYFLAIGTARWIAFLQCKRCLSFSALSLFLKIQQKNLTTWYVTFQNNTCDIYLWTGLSSMFSTSLSLIHLLLGKKYYVFKISDGSTFSN